MSDYGGVSTGAPNDADALKLAFSRLKPVDRDKTAPYVTNEDREKLKAIEMAEKEILADAWTRHCEGPNINNVRSSIDEKCFTALASDPDIQPYGLDVAKLSSDPPSSKDDFTTWALEERWVSGTNLTRVPNKESWEEHLQKRAARLKELKDENT